MDQAMQSGWNMVVAHLPNHLPKIHLRSSPDLHQRIDLVVVGSVMEMIMVKRRLAAVESMVEPGNPGRAVLLSDLRDSECACGSLCLVRSQKTCRNFWDKEGHEAEMFWAGEFGSCVTD